MFYCLVVGSRSFTDYGLLSSKLDLLLQNQVKAGRKIHIVSGGANGADHLAAEYAADHNYELHIFPAEWAIYGRKAGYIRNEQMHQFIAGFEHRGCVAFWDGKSRGTQHSFELAEKYNNNLRVIRF